MITLNKKLRLHLLLHNSLFVILLLLLITLLGYLAFNTRAQWDVSQNGRNSLSQASLFVLQKLNDPIEITAYATEQDAQFGDLRQTIRDFIVLYQRAKPDITLTFVNPVEQPKLAQAAGVGVNGEMVVTFKGRREHLTVINEQVFTNLLMRLARDEEKQIMVLAGHGERKLDGNANYDLGEFGKQLLVNGFNSRAVNLVTEQDMPIYASMLIIASPQTDLLPGEVDKLLAYIDRGGNLLWLIDQESLRGLLPLAEKLQLTLSPGVVVDPQAQQLKAPVTFALGIDYGQHAITHNFDYITVFPFARQIVMNENEEWHGVSLIEVAQEGWVETGDLDGDVSFDQMYDVAGPISIAGALSRTVEDREQRVVVIGSGHFLANNYLGNGGNLDFGINLVNWLAGDEDLITIQPRATRDRNLILSELTLTIIVVGFLIVLPLLFLLSGIFIWWLRRRR
ncbi:MAG: GldG family protein [Nitrosomonas sp.]|nr:GldG family protein [Nitrosomonas sp.]MDP1949538.1 GldG family protein [Nitrosomonas sp.]